MEIGRKKKSRADMLQLSYESFSKKFGCKKSRVKSAIKHLRALELIRTEFRTILIKSHIRCSNVMFIEPIPEAISAITQKGGAAIEKLGEGPLENVGELPEERGGQIQRLRRDYRRIGKRKTETALSRLK
jgi:hypothetical protein